MRNFLLIFLIGLSTFFCSHTSLYAQKKLNPNFLQKIKDALPSEAPAKPKKPRKLLIYTRASGFVHGSIPYGGEALRLLGEKTGAYTGTVSNDPAMFLSDSLKQFDGVFMVNTTGNCFMPKRVPADQKQSAKATEEQAKKSLNEFVRNGGGFAGCHAASDCYYSWSEYGNMIGGYFSGHPWHENVGVKLDNPKHPINAVFEGQGFSIVDEIYQFRQPYSRDNLHILMSLDVTRTNMKKGGIRRTDGDFAISWVRNYGKGRVYYNSLGHREEIYWNPQVLKHYLAGIQFSFGDLEADATPSAETDIAPAFSELLSGSSLNAFNYKSGGWTAEEGSLALQKGGGYIWTKNRYRNFILETDFKLSKGANSGIFIRTGNPGNPVQTGIEVQVLDSYGKEKPGKHDCGAIYDCVAPSKNPIKKPGEWNHFKITCMNNKIEVALNGEQIIDMDIDQWTEKGKNPDGSKNKFGTAYRDMPRSGHIGFQDHGNPVWYRNLNILPLDVDRTALLKTVQSLPENERIEFLLDLLPKTEDRHRAAARELLVYTISKSKDNSAAGLLLGVFEKADDQSKAALLPLLGRVGGDKALAALRSSWNGDNPALKTAALKGLAAWPDDAVAGDLLQIAKTSKVNAHRSSAIDGYIRLAGGASDNQKLKMLGAALKAGAGESARKLVINSLASVRSLEALRLAESYLGEKSLQASAGMATVKIATTLLKSHRLEAETALNNVMSTVKDRQVRRLATDQINKLFMHKDAIKVWLISGPYTTNDRNKLLGTPFAPEQPDADVEWKPVRSNRESAVDFNRIMRGSNRVVYLRTWVRAEKAQKTTMALGSDDGIKVWFNGKVVHNNNAWRAYQPGQDVISIDFKQGWNDIMIKVSQGGGDWAAGANFRSAKGGRASGLLLPDNPKAVEAAMKELDDLEASPLSAAAGLNIALGLGKKSKDRRPLLEKAADALEDKNLKALAEKIMGK